MGQFPGLLNTLPQEGHTYTYFLAFLKAFLLIPWILAPKANATFCTDLSSLTTITFWHDFLNSLTIAKSLISVSDNLPDSPSLYANPLTYATLSEAGSLINTLPAEIPRLRDLLLSASLTSLTTSGTE